MRTALPVPSSSIQTVTVGPGVSPSQRTPKYPVADFTASGESHPALKTKIQLFSSGDSIRQKKQKCNP